MGSDNRHAAVRFVSPVYFVADGIKQETADAFDSLLQRIPQQGLFFGDHLLTFSKNIGFRLDDEFMAAVKKNVTLLTEQTIIWRTHILAWAAHTALRRRGDFVECGCYRGTSARILCDYLGFGSIAKYFYLYDLFEHRPDMPHNAQEFHGPGLFSEVSARFADLHNVRVIQGEIPSVLLTEAPEEICFLHVDLNNAPAELGAYHALFDRVVDGGMIVIDDYGWLRYREQKWAADDFFGSRGYLIAELPTGQGLIIK